MKKLSFALLALSLLWACNNTEASAEEATSDSNASASLREEVMALHDKVMPEMTPMSKLQGELMTASVGRDDSADIMTVATELKYAKDAMMVWMREFSGNFDESWSEAEKVAFFTAEKAKMERIDAKTQEALANGKALQSKLSEEQSPSADAASEE